MKTKGVFTLDAASLDNLDVPYTLEQKFVSYARGVANALTHGDDRVVDLEVDPNAMAK